MIDVDTDRRFLQMMWGQGVAEEYQNGKSYVSGPDAFGETQKVTYVFSIDKDLISFGQDRACIAERTKHKCIDQNVAQYAGPVARRAQIRGRRRNRDPAMHARAAGTRFLTNGARQPGPPPRRKIRLTDARCCLHSVQEAN